jgi:hypothetical protein
LLLVAALCTVVIIGMSAHSLANWVATLVLLDETLLLFSSWRWGSVCVIRHSTTFSVLYLQHTTGFINCISCIANAYKIQLLKVKCTLFLLKTSWMPVRCHGSNFFTYFVVS